jgi:hypothetical protein
MTDFLDIQEPEPGAVNALPQRVREVDTGLRRPARSGMFLSFRDGSFGAAPVELALKDSAM